jgi:hypothetical protein
MKVNSLVVRVDILRVTDRLFGDRGIAGSNWY